MNSIQHYGPNGPIAFGAVCFLDKNRAQLSGAEILLDADGRADWYAAPPGAAFVRAKTSSGEYVYEMPIDEDFP